MCCVIREMVVDVLSCVQGDKQERGRRGRALDRSELRAFPDPHPFPVSADSVTLVLLPGSVRGSDLACLLKDLWYSKAMPGQTKTC